MPGNKTRLTDPATNTDGYDENTATGVTTTSAASQRVASPLPTGGEGPGVPCVPATRRAAGRPGKNADAASTPHNRDRGYSTAASPRRPRWETGQDSEPSATTGRPRSPQPKRSAATVERRLSATLQLD